MIATGVKGEENRPLDTPKKDGFRIWQTRENDKGTP